MTTLDMDALTERQRDVLGWIAIGLDGAHHPKVLAQLEAKGLIIRHVETLPGSPPAQAIRWEAPVDVHMQWAEWCSRQVEEGV